MRDVARPFARCWPVVRFEPMLRRMLVMAMAIALLLPVLMPVGWVIVLSWFCVTRHGDAGRLMVDHRSPPCEWGYSRFTTTDGERQETLQNGKNCFRSSGTHRLIFHAAHDNSSYVHSVHLCRPATGAEKGLIWTLETCLTNLLRHFVV